MAVKVFKRVRNATASAVFVAAVKTFEEDVRYQFVGITVILSVFEVSAYFSEAVAAK
jgi:hypothetical protein